ncbi:acyltransferase family protein [Alicyclobacillus acidiphilus]|uniref:acyltransferase family protein n=1 Tax=Alicyclobacillus acidiphilus TaxID=182455 RepID=UPI000833F558|nr:acyltransferase family protein [Alicyclobacillus acidiphilus]
MPRPVGGKTRYMPGLDGLRTFAVFAVIAYHLGLNWAPGGLLGVEIFFVLSGYLITDLLITEWKRNGRLQLGQFWLRRARRLLPAMFFMLLIVYVWVSLFDRAQIVSFRQDALASIFYVSNWWFIFHKVSYFASFGRQSPLGHLWSLAVEEQFYLLWPLILAFGLKFFRRRWKFLAITLVMALMSAAAMAWIYVPGTDPSRVYYGTDTRAFAFLIGAGLAFVWPSMKLSDRLSGSRRLLLDGMGVFALLAITYMIWQTNEYETFLYRGGLVVLSVLTALLIVPLAHPSSVLAKIFGCQPLRWLGVRSYGIYLWHFPIIILTTPLVTGTGINVWRDAAQVAASIAVAAVSWRLIEQPIRRWFSPKTSGLHRRRRPGSAARGARWIGVATGVCVVSLFGLAVTERVPTVIANLDVNDTHNVGKPVSVATTGNATTGNATTGNATTGNATTGNATTGNATTGNATTGNAKESGVGISTIGDSVMVDATPYLQQLLPGIVCDGQVGRQMYQAPQAIAELKAKGELGDKIIIELGTNGPFTKSELVSLLNSLGPMKRIVLVNTRVPRPWEQTVNQTLAEVAATYPNTTLVDWYDASAGKPNYFYSDGVHLNPTGALAYAKLLAKAVE